MAQWSIYGAGGIALESTPDMIRNAVSFTVRGNTSMGTVQYFPSDKPNLEQDFIKPPLLTRPYYVKAEAYKHENEIRFSMEINPDQCNSDESGGIVLEKLDPKKLIRRIVISPSIFDTEADDLRDLIKGLLPGIEVQVSRVKNADSPEYSDGFKAFQAHFSDPFDQLGHEVVGNVWHALPGGLFDDV